MSMDEQDLRDLLLGWPGTEASLKWGNDLVFCVAGKMFCVLARDDGERGRLSFKVEPQRFLEFTDRPGVRPAPYMARAHWITLDDPDSLDEGELRPLLRRAYQLVRARLPKYVQRELSP
jgi:predicted DNA-binding protein (MmcQ/YjbR family)